MCVLFNFVLNILEISSDITLKSIPCKRIKMYKDIVYFFLKCQVCKCSIYKLKINFCTLHVVKGLRSSDL